jgi:Tfp pilus assembly protein FimT
MGLVFICGGGMVGKSDKTKGFSVVEVIVVTALVAISVSVGVLQMRSSIALIDADKAANLVSAQVLYARQIAIAQRRNVVVSFEGTNEIKVIRQDGGGDTTVMADVVLPSGFTFSMPDDLDDTPDGFGNEGPVDFDTATAGRFLADGIFVNDDGDVLNGTVFTMSGSTSTARAVTLSGASGRIRTYHLEGDAWTE